MARYGVVAAGLVLILVLGLSGPSLANAQMSPDGILHRVGVQYWAATGTGPTTSWSSPLFRLQYTGVLSASPFGLQAQYVGGGGMGETFWAVDLTYRPTFAPPPLAPGTPARRVFASATAGYASFKWNVGGVAATSAGFGFGFDATVLLGSPARGGTVALLADYTTYPSNVTSGPGSPGTGPASVWSVAVHYKLPARMAAPMPGTISVSTGADIKVLGAEWDLNAGYRDVTVGWSSSYRWTGFFVGVGKTF